MCRPLAKFPRSSDRSARDWHICTTKVVHIGTSSQRTFSFNRAAQILWPRSRTLVLRSMPATETCILTQVHFCTWPQKSGRLKKAIPTLLISGHLASLYWSCLPAGTSGTTDQGSAALRRAKQGIGIGFVHLSYRVKTKHLCTSHFSMACYLWMPKHVGRPANVSNGLSVTSESFSWRTHPGSKGIATLAACTLLCPLRGHHLCRIQSRGVVE